MASDVMIRALRRVCSDRKMFGSDGACPVSVETPGKASRLVLVTGDNASGKSFFCRALEHEAWRERVGVIALGMRLRTASGMQSAFVYGEEDWNSTGLLSMQATLGGLRNVVSGETPRLLILDEPDIGLSEGFAAALGKRIAAFCADMPEKAAGVIVVTHSRAIAGTLVELDPWRVRVGEDLRPTVQWLREGPLPVDSGDIERLFETANERMRAISSLMDARMAAARKARATDEARVDAALREAQRVFRSSSRDESDDVHAVALSYVLKKLDEIGLRRDIGFGFVEEGGRLFHGDTDLGTVEVMSRTTRAGTRMISVRLEGAGASFPLTSHGFEDMERHIVERVEERHTASMHGPGRDGP